MRITQYTDYSLRVLLFLGLKGGRATVGEIASAFSISRNHVVKVVHNLGQKGYVKSFKGKSGGIVLARDPESIRVGDFVCDFEPMVLLECFNPATNTCPIQGACQLEVALHRGAQAFLKTLNEFKLSDFLKPGRARDERMARLGLKVAG